MNKDYSDIINLCHHTSLVHPRMSMQSRAAQFAPFSALSGYEDAVCETARLTDKRIEIDDNLKEVLNNRLMYAMENNICVTFTYFVYDKKKDGGKYIDKNGVIKKIDSIKQVIILEDNSKIPIKELINVDSDMFMGNI